MAQFTKEAYDDNENGNEAGDGGGAEKEAERTEKAMADVARGLLKLLGTAPQGH